MLFTIIVLLIPIRRLMYEAEHDMARGLRLHS